MAGRGFRRDHLRRHELCGLLRGGRRRRRLAELLLHPGVLRGARDGEARVGVAVGARVQRVHGVDPARLLLLRAAKLRVILINNK